MSESRDLVSANQMLLFQIRVAGEPQEGKGTGSSELRLVCVRVRACVRVCARVCVCMCVRERSRNRERNVPGFTEFWDRNVVGDRGSFFQCSVGASRVLSSELLCNMLLRVTFRTSPEPVLWVSFFFQFS